MTVNEIMESTGAKRGTVEKFRSELQKYKLIGNNESIDSRAFKVFELAISYRNSNDTTWEDSIQKQILQEYGEEMNLPFYWTLDIEIKHLIWLIRNNEVNVKCADTDGESEDFHVIYKVIIDNFKELASAEEIYSGSFGTDGNPLFTYKCIGDSFVYYIVGKYNHITREENIHVFYNDGLKFNIRRCEHICGGAPQKGRLKKLFDLCEEKARGTRAKL